MNSTLTQPFIIWTAFIALAIFITYLLITISALIVAGKSKAADLIKMNKINDKLIEENLTLVSMSQEQKERIQIIYRKLDDAETKLNIANKHIERHHMKDKMEEQGFRFKGKKEIDLDTPIH